MLYDNYCYYMSCSSDSNYPDCRAVCTHISNSDYRGRLAVFMHLQQYDIYHNADAFLPLYSLSDLF